VVSSEQPAPVSGIVDVGVFALATVLLLVVCRQQKTVL